MKLSVIRLGLIEYEKALELQQKIQRLIQEDLIENTLLLLEHPPVITVGVNGKNNNNILVNKDFLGRKGIIIYQSNRGGDVTYHGPGQIVGYPIINLNCFGKDVKEYVRRLEEVFIHLLKVEYGLISSRNSGYPGVWIENNKITALGCSVKRWVTMHGFAFNVNTNLEHFQWINPCGFTDRGVTSLQKILGKPQNMDTVSSFVTNHFSHVFGMETQTLDKETLLKRVNELSENTHKLE